jgi:hypothetical protein
MNMTVDERGNGSQATTTVVTLQAEIKEGVVEVKVVIVWGN